MSSHSSTYSKWLILAALGALALAALACIGGGTPPPAPTSTALPPPPTNPPLPQLADVQIVNQTSGDICYVYISLSTEDSWGEDRLGDSEIIGAGQSATISGLQPGTYDMRAEDCNNVMVAEQYSVQLQGGLFTWTVSGSATGGTGTNLQIVNQMANTAVCYVFISPSTESEWGSDQLGESNVIAPGASFTITNIPVGVYDIKAEDCENNVLAQEFEVQLSGGDFTWTISEDTNEFTIINNSSIEICYVYFSSSEATDWGPDQLGENTTIPPGQQFTIEGIPPGTYDLKVVTCDNQELEEYGIDPSVNPSYTITD